MGGVSRETESALRAYQTLLLKWQEKINLISPATMADSWARHFEDSTQIVPLVPQGSKTLYDLGSGAGFPGLILAIARPDIAVTLIESDAKKCAFLQAVSRETGVTVTIKNARIESVAREFPAPNVVTARALASLESLLDYAGPWAKSATMIFPKGENWQAEIDAANAAGWAFDYEAVPSKTEKNARILVLKSVRKSPV